MTANRIHNSGRGRLVSRDVCDGSRELAYHGVSLIAATAPNNFPVPMPDECNPISAASHWVRCGRKSAPCREIGEAQVRQLTNSGSCATRHLAAGNSFAGCGPFALGYSERKIDGLGSRRIAPVPTVFRAAILAACISFTAMADPSPAFYRALHQVETGGRTGAIKGDGGKALGPYQIHKAYWQDSRVPGRYEDCASEPYARRVVQAYLKRYAPQAFKAGDSQTLARTHNGGPSGHKKQATISYWRKVKSHL